MTERQLLESLRPLIDYWRTLKRTTPKDQTGDATVLAQYEDDGAGGLREAATLTRAQMQAIQHHAQRLEERLNHRGPFKALWNLIQAYGERVSTGLHRKALALRVAARPGAEQFLEDWVTADEEAWVEFRTQHDEGIDQHTLAPPATTGVYMVLCSMARESLVRFEYSPAQAIHLGREGQSPAVWLSYMYVEVDTSTGKVAKALGVGGERWSHVLAYHPSPTHGYPGFRAEHEDYSE